METCLLGFLPCLFDDPCVLLTSWFQYRILSGRQHQEAGLNLGRDLNNLAIWSSCVLDIEAPYRPGHNNEHGILRHVNPGTNPSASTVIEMVAPLGIAQVNALCRGERIVKVSIRVILKDIVAPSFRVKVNLPTS